MNQNPSESEFLPVQLFSTIEAAVSMAENGVIDEDSNANYDIEISGNTQPSKMLAFMNTPDEMEVEVKPYISVKVSLS